MLRYRRALAKAQAENNVLGEGVENLNELDTPGWAASVTDEWRNPMLVLASPPCDEIKWLFDKDLRLLRNYLGTFQPRSGAADRKNIEPDGDDGGSLMGPDPFELRFATTLLRADIFAGVQAKITEQLRRKQAADEALKAAFAPVGDASYDDMRETYREIRGEAAKVAKAVVDLLSGVRPTSPRRKGFQPENPNDPQIRATFHDAAPALTTLLAELDRLLKRLDNFVAARQKEPDGLGSTHAAYASPAARLAAAARHDRARFEKVLRELYA